MAEPYAIITEPPSAPTRRRVSSLWKGQTDGNDIEAENEKRFACLCRTVLKLGGYIVLLADVFMLNECLVAFCELGFDVMPYRYELMFSSDSVPNRSMFGFPKNAAQYDVLGKRAG